MEIYYNYINYISIVKYSINIDLFLKEIKLKKEKITLHF